MAHGVNWIELSAHDRQASARFFGQVFGWKHTDIPEMSYTTLETGEGIGLGLSQNAPPGLVLVYIHTDDIAQSLAAVEANGGKIVEPAFQVPTVGWLAVFDDPAGNRLALLQPEPMPG